MIKDLTASGEVVLFTFSSNSGPYSVGLMAIESSVYNYQLKMMQQHIHSIYYQGYFTYKWYRICAGHH